MNAIKEKALRSAYKALLRAFLIMRFKQQF